MHNWKEKLYSPGGKALCWALALTALFFGAFFSFGLLGAFYVGAYNPEIPSYWETREGYNNLSGFSYDHLYAWQENGWKEPNYSKKEHAEKSHLISYEMSYVDREGNVVKELHKADLEADTPTYRTYVQILPDSDFLILGAATFPNALNTPYVMNSVGVAWGDTIGEDALIPIQGSDEEQFEKSQLARLDIYVNEPALLDQLNSVGDWQILQLRDQLRMYQWTHGNARLFLAGFTLSAIAGLTAVVLLWLGAGHRPGGWQAELCWYDRIPMELHLALLCVSGFFLCVAEVQLLTLSFDNYLRPDARMPDSPAWFCGMCSVIPAVLGLCLLTVLFSFVRWGKQGNPLRSFWVVWIAGGLWQMLCHCVEAIPLMWGGTAAAALAILYIWVVTGVCYEPGFLLIFGLGGIVLVFAFFAYLARGLQALCVQSQALVKGDYNVQAAFPFRQKALREISDNISRVGEGMNIAVEERTKSERMKTELITNVSHDLKTPLTSIINYTDLLQKQELPPQAAEYADIIAKQGQRLHKLTLDLVEASKAASGVLNCNKEPTNLNELCEQAAGEYNERLTAAGLTLVLDLPEADLVANLDGRLTWRILDNLLSNACKYAQPGTRVYVVLSAHENRVALTVKNISRDPLNIPAEELMERFVRGDSARSSEGSGLGLSIARSLAELQGGQFGLYINGDLFQTEAVFPLA